jgi:hypothetical protein
MRLMFGVEWGPVPSVESRRASAAGDALFHLLHLCRKAGRCFNQSERQSTPAATAETACQSCGRGPARRLVIRRHVGMIFLQRFVRIEPTLCRDCGTRMILRYTGRTLVQGWWGLISMVFANPFTIVMNLVALVRARRLTPPQLSSR